MDIKGAIEGINIDVDGIAEPAIKAVVKQLLNIIEVLTAENKQLKEGIQKLRDENNHLKGEQGKPNVRPQKKTSSDVSSEADRKRRDKNKRDKKSKKKKHKIKVDRVQVCEVSKEQLPSDAVFKGYQSAVVQDIVIRTDNVLFKKQIFYSPGLKKTFIAPFPPGYDGEFGPGVKPMVLTLHHELYMTEPAIVTFLLNCGIFISAATVSRMLTDNNEVFHREKEEIMQAGLASTQYQHSDDTGARVNGKNHNTHVFCNPYFTAYFTRPNKSRLTILEILSQGKLSFQFDEQAFELMKIMNLPNKYFEKLKPYTGKTLNREEMDALLGAFFPKPHKHRTARQVILEGAAISAYRKLPNAVLSLICDDAPQFKLITEELGLCWVHDGRHYKKLDPIIPLHRNQLVGFRECYWDYYQKLLDFKFSPSPLLVESLSQEFDVLFSTKTGYDQLDARIQKTLEKKPFLLLVLKHSELPLHNNPAELGARAQARKRDVSLQTKNEKGTEGKDTFMTITQTAKKLAVNTFAYISDRVSKKFAMPSLASLIPHPQGVP